VHEASLLIAVDRTEGSVAIIHWSYKMLW